MLLDLQQSTAGLPIIAMAWLKQQALIAAFTMTSKYTRQVNCCILIVSMPFVRYRSGVLRHSAMSYPVADLVDVLALLAKWRIVSICSASCHLWPASYMASNVSGQKACASEATRENKVAQGNSFVLQPF